MGEIIGSVRVTPAQPRPWEPVLVEVLDPDGEPPGRHLDVAIDGVAGNRRWVQLGPGRHTLHVSARDGDRADVSTVACDVTGEPLLHRHPSGGEAPARIVVRPLVGDPYAVVLALDSPAPTAPTSLPQRLTPTELARLGVTSARALVRREPGPEQLEQLLSEARRHRASTEYHWDLGDGTQAVTSEPWVEHGYGGAMEHARPMTTFEVVCSIRDGDRHLLEVRRTLAIDSWYQRCRALGTIVCPVDAPSAGRLVAGQLQGRFVIHNPEQDELRFDQIVLRPLVPEPEGQRAPAPTRGPARARTDGDRWPGRLGAAKLAARRLSPDRGRALPVPTPTQTPPETPTVRRLAQAVVVEPGASTLAVIHVGIEDLPDDAFGYLATLAGTSASGVPCRASTAVEVVVGAGQDPGEALVGPPSSTWAWDDVRTRATAALRGVRLTQGTGRIRIGAQAVQVAAEDALLTVRLPPGSSSALRAPQLAALDEVVEQALAPVMQPRLGSGTFGPSAPPAEGAPCDPTNISDSDVVAADAQSLACTWSGTATRRVSGRFVNAFKGDIILSPGTGSPMALIYQNLSPPQAHSHAVMMTRNFDEVAHCFGSGDWLMADTVSSMSLDSVRFGWPGAIAQHAENAVEGELFTDPDGRQFEIRGVYPDAHGASFPDGTFRLTPALVLRPDPLLETPALRTRLRAAADAFRARCATAAGTPGRQSGEHFSFFTFTQGSFAAPAPDIKGDGTWPAGTLPGACSTSIWRALVASGVTFERAQGDPTVLEAGPVASGGDLEPGDLAASPFGGGASVVPGGVDGLYRYNPGERLNAGRALKEVLVHAAEEAHWTGPLLGLAADAGANVLLNLIASNSTSTGDEWQDPGVGETVSPDDMLFWDGPSSSGGAYGFAEPLLYREPRVEAVDTFVWTRYEKRSDVRIRTLLDGQPVQGVSVLFADRPGAVVTGADGTARFDDVAHGLREVTASAPGGTARAKVLVTVDGPGTIDVPLSRTFDETVRKVTVALAFVGVDDEWGDDEILRAPPRSHVFTVGPAPDSRRFTKKSHDAFLVYRWGGECRVEHSLTLSVATDFSLTATVRARMFEGTYENTPEQEDFATRTIRVPAIPGRTNTGTMTIRLDNDGDDRSRTIVTVTHGPSLA